MAELKPCPFCGGKAMLMAYDPFDGYQGNWITYRVFCVACRAKIEYDKEEKAIEAWNRRAEDEPC